MAATLEPAKKTRAVWKQADIATLVTHYQHGGIASAVKALPGKTRLDIDAKLIALGLLKMSENDHAFIAELSAKVRACDNPALVARGAIKVLRELAKETD